MELILAFYRPLFSRSKPELIPATLTFDEVLERVKNSNATTFPIVDDKECLVGIFSLSDIRKIINEQAIGSLVVAGDLGTTSVVTVTMDTNLSDALTLFTQRKINVLPVVEVPPPEKHARTVSSRKLIRPRGLVGNRKVIAMLTRQDLIDAYRKRIFDLESADAKESAGSNVFTEAQVAVPDPTPEQLEEERTLVEMLTKPSKPDLSDPNAEDKTMVADLEEEKKERERLD
jgi:CBS domain-containing protein